MKTDAPRPDAIAKRESPRARAHVSLRTFDYGRDSYSVDPGQVIRLEGLANDKLLVDLRYIVPMEDGTTTYPCRVCGREFVNLGMLNGHGKARHEPSKFVPPAPPVREAGETKDQYQNRLDEWAIMAGRLSESNEDARDRMENAQAPLDLTKTAASREA